MGELAIVRAREKAEKTLGAKFNIRAFHDAVLELGSVPLPACSRMLSELLRRGLTASSLNMAKALTRIWSDYVSGLRSGRRGDRVSAAPPKHIFIS